MAKCVLAFVFVVCACTFVSEARAQCEMATAGAHGCVWTNMKGPLMPGKLERGSKVGRACAWNFGSLIAKGDLRIETAMKNGGITKVSSVDSETQEFLSVLSFVLAPLWARYCTVVTGE